MQSIASARLILAALALLTVGSVGLKGAAGPAVDRSVAAPDQLNLRLARTLQGQGFSTALHRYPDRSPAILATRGECRLSVRDAVGSISDSAIFAVDARGVGAVHYLYDGKTYSAPPAFAMRLGRLKAEVESRLGIAAVAPIPLAIAASSGCGPSNFGLEELR